MTTILIYLGLSIVFVGILCSFWDSPFLLTAFAILLLGRTYYLIRRRSQLDIPRGNAQTHTVAKRIHHKHTAFNRNTKESAVSNNGMLRVLDGKRNNGS